MANTNKKIAPLPKEFPCAKEAGAFWDTHSLADYEEFLEPVELDARIERRHFEIEVDEPSFLALRSTAHKQHKPIMQLASEILKRGLVTT